MARKELAIGSGMLGGAAQGAATGAMVGGPTGALIGGAIGGVAGGALAYMAQADAAKSVEERKGYIQAAVDEINNIQTPELKAAAYEELRSAGYLTPELEKAFTVGPSAMEGVSTDPKLREAQLAALSQLAELGKGGMDVKDLADVERSKQQFRGEQAAQQAAIQENMARRGITSGGTEMVLRDQAAQNAANQMNQYEQQVQGEARRRALEAIMQQGALAGNLRTQDFSEAERRAQAADAIAKFNAQMQSGTERSNIDAINRANASNLANKQGIMSGNTQLKNQQLAQQAALPKTQYEMNMNKAVDIANLKSGFGNIAKEQAADTRQMYGDITQAVGKGAEAYGAYEQGKTNRANTLTDIKDQRAWQEEQNRLNREAWLKANS